MLATIQVVQATVILVMFAFVVAVGLLAGRWRKADMHQLEEWALGGRHFGGFLTWFLQGGSVYTTYSFIAVPALVFGVGALGFFALPYLIIAYLVAFLVLPKLWDIYRRHNHVTAADFVRERFDSPLLALAITVTGILATVPYIALQVYGIEVSIAQIGLPVEVSLFIAFGVLAVVTYVSGLRSATLIAVVKDVFIWTTVIVAIIYIPIHLGGYVHIFAQLPRSKLVLQPTAFDDYVTLAVGSGLALFLYPHTLTGALSSSSRFVVQRNAIFLPIYTIMLGLLALLGYMAIAAHMPAEHTYGANAAVPELFDRLFPAPFAGFALASISIGALVPAAMMAISSANLFSRNIYLEYIRPDASPERQTAVSKIASTFVKLDAVLFVVLVPTTYIINFQLAGGIWILQTLPAVFLALFTKRLHRGTLFIGWACGMLVGTGMLLALGFKSSSINLNLFGWHASMYIAIPALVVNLAITGIGMLIPILRRSGSTGAASARADADPHASAAAAMPQPVHWSRFRSGRR
ncbi:MAG: sodium:solute symporter [Actinobacteria bacterium]|jgi:SSS family solute:Na+ symporter|nr:sodium:solute symporter [Actinomycetota bacterium]